MATLLALDLDRVTAQAVSAVARDVELSLADRESDAALRQLANATDLEVVVIGRTDDPVRIARRVQVAQPGALVFILASTSHSRAVREALQFNPLGSRSVLCIENENADAVRSQLRDAIATHRRQIQPQGLPGALNRQLQAAPPRTRSAEVLLGRVLALAPVAILIADTDGRIREINPRGAEVFDHLGDLIGTELPALFSDGAAATIREMLADVRQDPTRERRASVVRGTRHLEITTALANAATEDAAVLLVIDDVTEREQLIGQLRTANRAKDEFIAMLGHELRNPLAPIRTALDLIKLRDVPAIERERTVIERHVTHMVQLVDDLLDVARIVQGKLMLKHERHRMADIIARAVELASPLLDQRRQLLQVSVPADGLDVNGDETRLAQVFTNLLTNAAKYTDPGGAVFVEGVRDGDHVVVRVRDTGRGIAPDLLPHIFEAFVQERQESNRAAGGLGLGLAIVHSLTKLHGGEVQVVSELGRGSEFTVTLPRADTATTAVAHVPAAAPATSTTRLLVVDDNEDAAMLISEILRSSGFVVDTAHDAPSAFECVRRAPPDVVLLDIGLPVMDGYELGQRLRALPGLAHVRLIAVSGYGDKHDRAKSASLGFFDHLVKPVDLATLREVIARALRSE